uniref:NADH-ubiquinone oxidoreductase chain 3 n=1 Tax=Salina celebensis TaxID=1588069 RepID=A0A6G6A653_9HEXA|nr:NADH dehydrogenase subunit 3 [Salina celebensis]QID03179.1 NADH dehydrogenase subunit 3 [Salina celebensis]
MILIFLFSLVLSIILIIVNSLIAKKSTMDREKPSPFECGFDPKSTARVPFSLRFYLIALVFLIFDVEITLILPIPVLPILSNTLPLLILSCFFIIILIVGLFHEWNEGALNWDK